MATYMKGTVILSDGVKYSFAAGSSLRAGRRGPGDIVTAMAEVSRFGDTNA